MPVSSSSSANRAFFPFELGLLEVAPESLVCMRREAVRTNWPTAALKPLRKALNGYWDVVLVMIRFLIAPISNVTLWFYRSGLTKSIGTT